MLAFLFLRLKNNIEKTLCTSNSFFCLFFFAIISAICVCEKRKEQKKTRKSHRLSNFCVFVIRFENSVCWRLPYYSILSMLCSFLFIFMFRILNFFFFASFLAARFNCIPCDFLCGSGPSVAIRVTHFPLAIPTQPLVTTFSNCRPANCSKKVPTCTSIYFTYELHLLVACARN